MVGGSRLIADRVVYTRKKENNYQFKPVPRPAKGRHTSPETGPFHIQIYPNGQQQWPVLYKDGTVVPKREAIDSMLATSVPEAYAAADLYDAKLQTKRTAVAHGLEITPGPGDENRVTLRNAVDHFLEEGEEDSLSPNSLAKYRSTLEEFLEIVKPCAQYLDQIEETKNSKGIEKRFSSVLRRYRDVLEAGAAPEKGAPIIKPAARTVANKMDIVFQMLKEAGLKNPSKLAKTPEWEEEQPVAYSEDELRKLFEVMDKGQKVAFSFFLYTACRDAEVHHATWGDLKNRKYEVRAKTYRKNGNTVHYALKTKGSKRDVPMPDVLIKMLNDYKLAGAADSDFIFTNGEGNPEQHFLRQLKVIAKRAGLICGKCKAIRKKATDRYGLKPAKWMEESCADNCQVCERHYLHRFRKTRATFWHKVQSLPLVTIMRRLGHTDMQTTMHYLGIDTDTQENAEKENQRMF
jgi:integrase